MFSCEFCEIFKNSFFTEHFQATTSVHFLFFSQAAFYRLEAVVQQLFCKKGFFRESASVFRIPSNIYDEILQK